VPVCCDGPKMFYIRQILGTRRPPRRSEDSLAARADHMRYTKAAPVSARAKSSPA